MQAITTTNTQAVNFQIGQMVHKAYPALDPREYVIAGIVKDGKDCCYLIHLSQRKADEYATNCMGTAIDSELQAH